MSFRFRRTLGIVPGIRLNLSRSGPSVSFGMRGLHYTVGLKGTRTTVGVPGTGASWTRYQSYSSGRRSQHGNLLPVTAPDLAPTEKVFESATIERLVAAST